MDRFTVTLTPTQLNELIHKLETVLSEPDRDDVHEAAQAVYDQVYSTNTRRKVTISVTREQAELCAEEMDNAAQIMEDNLDLLVGSEKSQAYRWRKAYEQAADKFRATFPVPY